MDILTDYLQRVATYPLWIVAIELLLIALVVYWAVDFLEGTRGERLFRGVILILVIGFIILKLLVGLFAFERLQYLYNGFLIFVLIIAVAGFQPEIRRALIRIGQPRFLLRSPQQLSKTIQEIATAVSQLSATRTGAIIVLEKKVALGDLIESGVTMDAEVTAELLRTIFYPGSPLHDMAVVIREDRIIAARVQLPLAEAEAAKKYTKGQQELQKMELGSRHRAAIGVSAGTDATCLVVSEETGMISVAENGILKTGFSESQLRKHLTGTIEEMVGTGVGGFIEWLWGFTHGTSRTETKNPNIKR